MSVGALLWLVGVAAFVGQSSDIAERFAALARGPYLAFAALAQLRVLLAFVVMGLVGTALVAPWVGGLRGLRWLGAVLALDVVALVLASGPALLASPGSFDTVERKTRVDLSALVRWHGLEGLAVGFALVVVAALAWWIRGRRARLVLLGLGAAGVLVSAVRPAPPRARPPKRPNVLVIAADSWRFDRLGAHGNPRPGLTPNLDAFARDAVDLRQHHVATASTLESWATVLTGQRPPRHGLRSMYPSREEVRAVEENPDTLPRVLGRAGYRSFVSSDWVGNCFDLVDFGFSARDVGPVQSFEALLLEATMRSHVLVSLFFGALPGPVGDVFIPGRASLAWAARPSVLTERLFGHIDDALEAGEPFFGVLFLSPTHLPYNARHPFNMKYAAPGYRGPHRYQVEVTAHELITTGFAPTLPPEVVQHVRDLYDGAVSDFDDTVGQVLAALAARGLDEHTIVIVTSDHGEDLYDPGSTLGHGTNFFGGDQSTRVPFLVRAKGLEPHVVEAVTRNVDVAPSVLRLVGLEVPTSMEGVELTPLLRGETADLGLIALAETCYLFFPKAKAMTGLSDAERAEVVDLAGAADTLEVDPAFRHNLVLRPAYRQAVIDAKDRMARDARYKLIRIPGRTRPLHRLYDMVGDPQQREDLSGRGLEAEAVLGRHLDAYEAPMPVHSR